MFETQKIIPINKADLLKHVKTLEKQGCRLVQISCTQTQGAYQMDYSFEKDYEFYNLRLELSLTQPELPSISKIYLAAFLYENEIHDLFGIKISGIAVDFQGKFYRINETAPFSQNISQEKE